MKDGIFCINLVGSLQDMSIITKRPLLSLSLSLLFATFVKSYQHHFFIHLPVNGSNHVLFSSKVTGCSKMRLYISPITAYSKVSNNRTVSNKSVQGCNFELLLHKNARFWPILANSCHQINSRTCTFIKDLRVLVHTYIKYKVSPTFLLKMC